MIARPSYTTMRPASDTVMNSSILQSHASENLRAERRMAIPAKVAATKPKGARIAIGSESSTTGLSTIIVAKMGTYKSGSSRSRDCMTDRVSSADRCDRAEVMAGFGEKPSVRSPGAIHGCRETTGSATAFRLPAACQEPVDWCPGSPTSGWSRNPSWSASPSWVSRCSTSARRESSSPQALSSHAARSVAGMLEAASNSLPIWLQRAEFIGPSPPL